MELQKNELTNHQHVLSFAIVCTTKVVGSAAGSPARYVVITILHNLRTETTVRVLLTLTVDSQVVLYL
jgi:hypothetical protein